jgi:ABC-2 type transport system ATP-binding protein
MASSFSAPLVSLRRFSKRYGTKQVLGPLDLELARCEVVGVVGPDGAGKTTLLRSLAGLLEIEAERASVLGFDLRADVTEMKRHIGYVPQAFSLQRELSVMENLRFTARLHRIDEQEFRRRSSRLLSRTGLAPFPDRAAGALSGGMKHTLAIANALLVEPALVVLDEPTAGVDVVARGEIWELLQAEKSRALVVLSTSYLDEAARCDRLVYLDRGRVVATGSPEDLRVHAELALFRVWGGDARSLARAARSLPYVEAARASAGFARVEVGGEDAPDDAAVLRDLARLDGALFAERADVDMETTLLALARRAEAA